jgi:hypothetical protein
MESKNSCELPETRGCLKRNEGVSLTLRLQSPRAESKGKCDRSRRPFTANKNLFDILPYLRGGAVYQTGVQCDNQQL